MAHFRQRGERWRAQVYKRGVRRSAEFDTRAEAEKWAIACEQSIMAHVMGGRQAAIQPTREEFTEIHARAKENARQRGIAFEITRDDVVTLYARSYGVCEVSGITFNRFRPEGTTKRPWYPSLDRIDSRGPYLISNCRFVCVAVNFAMGEWGEWVLKAVAKALIHGAPGQINVGTEAPYRFEPLGSEPTPRQLARRRSRKLTHQEPTEMVSAG